MILIERKYNGDRHWAIGKIEMINRGDWIWDCFDCQFGEYEEIFSSGCATSRKDAESMVREEWRNQLKEV